MYAMEQEIREGGLCMDNKEETVCQEILHKRNDQRTYGNLWIWTLMKDKKKQLWNFWMMGKHLK